MAWKRKPMPTISGYESLGDDVRAKRFLDFKLNQLLTTEDPVWEFRDEFASRGEVVNFVIERFEYPIVRGVPNDKHTMNWFGGRECYTITADYWQDAAETLRTLILSEKREGRGAKGMGDCEDTSVLLVDLFLERGWGARAGRLEARGVDPGRAEAVARRIPAGEPGEERLEGRRPQVPRRREVQQDTLLRVGEDHRFLPGYGVRREGD